MQSRMPLYSLIKTKSIPDSEFQYGIKLEAEHAIFRGHFPDQPVLPGVAQIEILGSAIELETKKKADLDNAKSIKFLKVIDPNKVSNLNLKGKIIESSPDHIKVSAVIDTSEGLYFKFKGTFKLSD